MITRAFMASARYRPRRGRPAEGHVACCRAPQLLTSRDLISTSPATARRIPSKWGGGCDRAPARPHGLPFLTTTASMTLPRRCGRASSSAQLPDLLRAGREQHRRAGRLYRPAHRVLAGGALGFYGMAAIPRRDARRSHVRTHPSGLKTLRVDAGWRSSRSLGRIGRRTSSPVQLGQRPPSTPAAHSRQNVHS